MKYKEATVTLSNEERSKRNTIIQKFLFDTREEWKQRQLEAEKQFNNTCPHCGHMDVIDRFDYHTPVNHCTKCNHEWEKATTQTVGSPYPFNYDSLSIYSFYYWLERILRDNNFNELKQQILEDDSLRPLQQAPKCVLEHLLSSFFAIKWPNVRPIHPEMEWNKESWLDYTFPENIWKTVQQMLNIN